jgi:hypothetical protein
MYVSFDDGVHWQSLQLNLPVTSIRDLDLHHDAYSDDLVVATHGRAFWVLDDISALRQLDATRSGAATVLFKPADAVRMHLASFTGTPLHADEPSAPNPPDGAILDYWLRDDVQSPVTLEILDARGKSLRRFSSADPLNPPDLSKINATPDWYAAPTPLKAGAGLHRFVWDLRYLAPLALRGDDVSGVWVLPGRYTVRLVVDGKTYSQPLTVRNDPRVKATSSDLARQQALAFKIQTQRDELADAVKEVSSILKQVTVVEPKAPAELAAKLRAFEAQITALTELHAVAPGYGQPGSSPERVGSLAYVAAAFDALQPAVENADSSPTPDALKGYAEQKRKAGAAIADWQRLKAGTLPALNVALQQAGLEPLKQ